MDWTSPLMIKILNHVCFVLLIGISTGDCSICTNEAIRLSLPVVRFCSDDQTTGSPVILDGYHFNTLRNVNNCTCVAKGPFTKATKTLFYTDIDSISSPWQNNITCGSLVLFRQFQETQRRMCQIGGYFSINITEDVHITVIKENDPEDTRYCFKLFVDSRDIINLECHIPDTNELTTNDKHQETTEASTLVRNNNPATTLQTTYTQETHIDLSGLITTEYAGNDSFQFTEKMQNRRSSTNVYIGIGGGTFVLLIALIFGIACLRKARLKKGQSEDSYDHCEDNDDYGLQYNTLYVSADDDVIPQTNANQAPSDIHLNTVAYQVEGNYSEIDLNDVKTKRKTTELVKQTCLDHINIEGNYSEIDHGEYKQSTASSNNDENFKENETSDTSDIEDEFLSKDNTNSLTSVRQGLARGDERCEYAVVEKLDRDRIRNYVYAVVDKNRKRSSK